MSTALLDAVVKKNRVRLIPFMLALYVLAFLDRSNIGFAKQTYQIDTGVLIHLKYEKNREDIGLFGI